MEKTCQHTLGLKKSKNVMKGGEEKVFETQGTENEEMNLVRR